MGDCIRNFYRGYEGGYRSLDYSSYGSLPNTGPMRYIPYSGDWGPPKWYPPSYIGSISGTYGGVHRRFGVWVWVVEGPWLRCRAHAYEGLSHKQKGDGKRHGNREDTGIKGFGAR